MSSSLTLVCGLEAVLLGRASGRHIHISNIEGPEEARSNCRRNPLQKPRALPREGKALGQSIECVSGLLVFGNDAQSRVRPVAVDQDVVRAGLCGDRAALAVGAIVPGAAIVAVETG